MLSEDEIKMVVVDDKWQVTLKAAIQTEIERVTQQLVNRVKTLEERRNRCRSWCRMRRCY